MACALALALTQVRSWGECAACAVCLIKNVVKHLAVMRRGVGGSPLADDLVRLVDADVVLVAVVTPYALNLTVIVFGIDMLCCAGRR